MRILIVGNGAREHAIAWRLKQSPKVSDLFAAPGNAGIARLASCLPIDGSDIIKLREFAQDAKVDLTVVGPELPLGLGLVDEFAKYDMKVFGPNQAAAEIETSKVFAKRFMQSHDIPTAAFDVCNTPQEAEAAIERRAGRFPIAIKADGLAGGKGVVIAASEEEARAAIQNIMVDRAFGNAGASVIVEDGLVGREISFQVISDGSHIATLAPAQDYKRALDGDSGPNTGGMGSLSPAKVGGDLGRQIMDTIVAPTISGLAAENRRFVGVLFVGIMLTDDGPRVLEYNARFGDPETQSILPRLESDLLDLFMAAVDGKLDTCQPEWKKEVSVSVVVASGGYPGPIKTGLPISGIEAAEKSGAHVFHGGTAVKDGEIVTSAGRVLTVNACAPSRKAARELAYHAVQMISFDNMHYRRDIGEVAPEEQTGVHLPLEG